MNLLKWGIRIVFAAPLLAVVSAAFVLPAQGISLSTTICGVRERIADSQRKIIKDAIYSHKQKSITLNCHDFKIKVRLTFVVRDKQYDIRTTLEHVIALATNEKIYSSYYLSQRGDKLRQYKFSEGSEQKGLAPKSDAWKLFARELTTEVAKVVQREVKAVIAECPGARDHREIAVIKCVLPGVIRDARQQEQDNDVQ